MNKEVHMARREQDTRLLDLWQEASEEGDDGIRRLLETVVQRVLDEELTAFLGAESHERTAARQGYRNGYKPRQLKTRVGTLELLVPKDREGRFRTELFERYQRSEKALVLAMIEMYVQGVSTRKVKGITEALCGLEISRTQVSELAKGLDAEIEAWRSRPLSKGYPYLVVDARYEKVRQRPHVASRGVLLVVGIGEETATARFWARTRRIPRARRRGRRCSRTCGSGDFRASGSSSRTTTRGFGRPSAGTSRERCGSGARCTSCGTCWPACRRETGAGPWT